MLSPKMAKIQGYTYQLSATIKPYKAVSNLNYTPIIRIKRKILLIKSHKDQARDNMQKKMKKLNFPQIIMASPLRAE